MTSGLKDDPGASAAGRPARRSGLADLALAAVADLVPHVVFAKDSAGRYVLSNRAHAALLGRREASAVIGRTAAELGFGDDERLRRIEGAGLPLDAVPENVAVPAAGGAGPPRLHRILLRRLPPEPGAGPNAGVVGISMDVTETVDARDARDDQVARRMRDMAVSVREAQAFGYSVSHDLRAPVRAISGLAQILLDNHGAALPGEARRLVERIAAAGVTMGAMVEGMLTLSQVSRAELRRSSIDLSALVKEVWTEVALAEPARSVEFTAAEGAVIWADAPLVRSVIQNLLGNAFKYTRGRERAQVEFGIARDASGEHFFVRDNGSGFDIAHAGKLFGAFHRLHHASEFEGTGIGLATAHRIVQRHAGRIWAEAKPGEGATFRFTFGPQRS